jgi:integrase
MVTGNYFSVLTVQPILGRVLVPSDDIEHAGNPVIVLSDEYWHSHFGSDPAVLNRVVHINGQALTIVGVAQHRGFMDKHPSDVFIPLSVEQAINTDRYDRLVDPLFRWLVVFGRLSPGMTRSRALSEVNRHTCVQRLIDAEFPLKTIGDYVGHRSPESTRVYSKVAIASLREVAMGDGEEL